ncbi:MAG: DMT family transporter [Anaerolineae bacterium]|nr:DMT family transporter [Anaerolineae bacterium]
MSGEAIALLSALLWAFASVLMGWGVKRLHVVPLNLIRCVVSTVFFWSLLPFFGGLEALAAIPVEQWLWLFLSVVMLLIVGDLLYFRSLDMAGVSWTMPVASVNPLWAVLLAALFIDEPLSWSLFAGTILVIAGLVLVGRSTPLGKAGPIDHRRQRIGLLLALLTSVAWGAGQVILKPATEGLDSVVANSVRQPVAAVMMLGLALARGRLKDLRQLDRRPWLAIVAASLVGTGLGSLLFVMAIQMVGAGRTAVLTSTAPLMAIPLAVLWLHERPSRRTLIGTLLATTGIILVA